jgi:hypothetical protein
MQAPDAQKKKYVIKVPAGATPEERETAIAAGWKRIAKEISDEVCAEIFKDMPPKGHA